ncbi:MAG: peptide deformylase [bacterium]|nr:peptide deformylase [bacterium]
MIINENLWTIDSKSEEKFLRRKAVKFDFAKYSKKEIRELLQKMREIMQKANGIGLSANQIGLDFKVFVAQPDKKFYAIFNPELVKESGDPVLMEEGCLSVPLAYGVVERADKVVLTGWDQNNKKVKIKAWGLLARVFQHEMDHLNGKLFIDRCKDVKKHEATNN